jgi:glycosyltransferase involved in cell wall biosynthesis
MGGPFRPWWHEALPAFDTAGVELIAATLFESPSFHEEMKARGVSTLSLGCRGSRDYPRAASVLARRARRSKLDVLHGVESIPAAISSLAGVLARGDVLRVFHRQHLVPKPPSSYFARAAQQWAHLVLMPSQSVADRAVRKEHVPAGKVRLVYNGAPSPREVAPAELVAQREALGIPTAARVVSMVTRLRVEKGVQFFLPAVAEASARIGEEVHAVVVGTGPLASELHAQADRLDLNIHWVGYQSDVAPWFQLSDVVCLPSLFDALPYSGVEAMGSGRAVVASNVGGIPELVEDGNSGLLVPPGDAAALADAIVRLLADDGLRSRLGSNAQMRFQSSFTAAANARAIIDAWRETA